MIQNNADEIRQTVRNAYGAVAKTNDNKFTGTGAANPDNEANAEAGSSCCSSNCCSDEQSDVSAVAQTLGYTETEIDSAPDGANLGLGCGNPQAIAALRAGETVLDLGSGAGFDCFLAAKQVGPEGHVIGVDMTSEMLNRARANADKIEVDNVDFRLGEIEHLPVANQSVDVIISNCVINLSPEKQAVFDEAYRVLKPGGRVAVSDIVTTADLPESLRNDMALYTGCLAGASPVSQIKAMMKSSGFTDISITSKEEGREIIRNALPDGSFEDVILSADIKATKHL